VSSSLVMNSDASLAKLKQESVENWITNHFDVNCRIRNTIISKSSQGTFDLDPDF
jgi:hypothetical protein